MVLQSKTAWALRRSHMEVNNLPSKTVPDESLSIPQIFERYVRGQPLQVHTRPAYYANNDIDSMDIEQFGRMDLTDKYEIQQSLAESNKAAVEALKARKAKKVEKVEEPAIVPPAPAPAPVNG